MDSDDNFSLQLGYSKTLDDTGGPTGSVNVLYTMINFQKKVNFLDLAYEHGKVMIKLTALFIRRTKTGRNEQVSQYKFIHC